MPVLIGPSFFEDYSAADTKNAADSFKGEGPMPRSMQRDAHGNDKPIPDSIEFELRQCLNVLALDAWSLRRLSAEKPEYLPPAVARVVARQEKTIARMSALAILAGGGQRASRSKAAASARENSGAPPARPKRAR
jgi:hypothetical protein